MGGGGKDVAKIGWGHVFFYPSQLLLLRVDNSFSGRGTLRNIASSNLREERKTTFNMMIAFTMVIGDNQHCMEIMIEKHKLSVENWNDRHSAKE